MKRLKLFAALGAALALSLAAAGCSSGTTGKPGVMSPLAKANYEKKNKKDGGD